MSDGPNLYTYCNNDPVNYVDLWGLSKAEAAKQAEDLWNKSLADLWTDLVHELTRPKSQAEIDAMIDDAVISMALGMSKVTTFWQYSTKGKGVINSPWFTKGKGLNPPYKVGSEARKALNLPPWNKGTQAKPYYPENIAGPRRPPAQPQWKWYKKGKGWEYYDAANFPD